MKDIASMSKITPEEFDDIVKNEIPWVGELGISVERLSYGEAILRLPYNERTLRPGGTISGPSMMAFADICFYATIQTAIGVEKMAVTTNLNINFMRRPRPNDLLAEGRLLKLGSRLAVMEVSIHSEGTEDLVAHATSTFSLPPRNATKS